MDCIRTFYEADCQFGTDPNFTRRIRWYRCAPGAKIFRGPHSFASADWYGDEPYMGIGEHTHVKADYWKGNFPVPVPGTHAPCGPHAVFLGGWPGPIPDGLERWNTGLAKCCDTVTWNSFVQHNISATIARPRSAFHSISSVIGSAFVLSHTVSAAIADLHLVEHSVSAIIGGVTPITHTVSAVIAELQEAAHTVSAAVRQTRTIGHTVSSIICRPSGTFLTGPAAGFWHAPPGTDGISAFLYAAGGDGSNGPGATAGGGGGSFCALLGAAVTPMHFYVYRVEPGTGSAASEFFSDTRHMFALNGQVAAGTIPGNGGSAAGGDVNFRGGDGGAPSSGPLPRFGGSGGQVAGPRGDGAPGLNGTSNAPGGYAGGLIHLGYGGPGGNPNYPTDGFAGGFPGGGGGGAGWDGIVSLNGGPGAGGLLIVCWSAAVHFVNAAISQQGNVAHSISAAIAGQGSVGHTISAAIATFDVLLGDDDVTVLMGDDGVTILTPGA